MVSETTVLVWRIKQKTYDFGLVLVLDFSVWIKVSESVADLGMEQNPIQCCVPKRIPDIIDCNLKKDYQILIVFGKNIPDTSICSCTTWGNQNKRNITFLFKVMWLFNWNNTHKANFVKISVILADSLSNCATAYRKYLKYWPFVQTENTGMQMLSLFIDSSVDNITQQCWSHSSLTLTQNTTIKMSHQNFQASHRVKTSGNISKNPTEFYSIKPPKKPPTIHPPKNNPKILVFFCSNNNSEVFKTLSLGICNFLDIYLMWTLFGSAHSNNLKLMKTSKPIKLGLSYLLKNRYPKGLNPIKPTGLCF